jgi:hypothetical protein
MLGMRRGPEPQESDDRRQTVDLFRIWGKDIVIERVTAQR